jgi:glucuronoarabinoxylan endo-1,4-beta-xylanase
VLISPRFRTVMLAASVILVGCVSAGSGDPTGTSGAGGTGTGTAGTSGSGGTTGSAGTTGNSGTAGTTGVTGTGGATGTGGRGGTTGAGGTTGVAGTNGHGGTTGAGGTTGVAGTNGHGGTTGAGGTTGIAGTNGGIAGTSGGTAGTTGGACTPGTATSGSVSVNTCTLHQNMDGFGAADTWAGPLTAAQNTLFWDPTNGIGLSILRIGIDVNGTPLGSGAYSDAMAANKFGVKVWGAPWSPPAADKSNNSEDNGGTLNTSAYTSWANVLAGFATTFKSKTGFALYAVSAQNEPDFTASYASCIYSGAQMVAFIQTLGPALHAAGTKLLAAEPDSWSNLWGGDNFGNDILNDATAKGLVDIMATHDYGHKSDSVTTRPAPPAGMTMPLWETEMSDETAADVDIAHGIQVATWIYAGVTTGGASAWHYWWLINSNTDGEGLLQMGGDTTNPPKRLYTMGNFSKFVRPGYARVDVSGTIPAGLLVSAFKNPADGTIVVVAINPNTGSTTLPVYLSGSSVAQVTPYVTSASQNLAAGTAIAVSGSSFSASLAGQTVTTFVGKP